MRPHGGTESPIASTSLSTGLVHDYLLVMRGAERTFAAIAECWPDAPIYTLLYDPRGTGNAFAGRTVHASYLQRLGVRQAGFRRLLPLFPRAAERLPVQRDDLVISSTSAFAHGVRPRPGATHIAYCHSPFRYAWHSYASALAEAPRAMRPLLGRVLRRIRQWDIEASRRVSHYVANSELSRRRIHDYYGLDARVVHPPVDVDRFAPGVPEDFFLIVTELVPHKRVENALKACRRAQRRLVVVGGGPERMRLSREYGGTATFMGRVSDAELAGLYSRALALIVPNVEEFGIAAVEAQAAGRPVLAVDAGGARETVIPSKTGVLVPPEDVDSLAEAIRHVQWTRFTSASIREHAQQFSRDAFKRRFTSEVARLLRVEVPAASS